MAAILRPKKTKIVATIGPASESEAVLERLIEAGLNIVRLNFAHGDHESHTEVVRRVRRAAQKTGHRVAIFGDLPGPKMRIGALNPDPILLKEGEPFCLTTRPVVGHQTLASLSLETLPHVVRSGDRIFLNDGFIQLNVTRVEAPDVHTTVAIGGELRSHKGVNFPGIDLGVKAFTEADHEHLRLAARLELDGVSQSFVRTAEDLEAVRAAAEALDYAPLLIAKIERSEAVERLEEILEKADGLMVARGDLGVEIPIEDVAPTQKEIIRLANVAGKPVITATQMLESMISNNRPTRAEATDVANAILDGTDCVMLSGETAMGDYPVEAVDTMRRIAERTERLMSDTPPAVIIERIKDRGLLSKVDTTSVTAQWLAAQQEACAVVVPTKDGQTPRRIARFRLPVWILAIASSEALCRKMAFSFGIHGVVQDQPHHVWLSYVRELIQDHGISGDTAVLVRTAADTEDGYSSHFDIIDLRA